MTITTEKRTLDEWLTYTDGTDTRYELVNGSLLPMSLGTGKHGSIDRVLSPTFLALNLTANQILAAGQTIQTE